MDCGGLRSQKKLPIFIEEDHHEVLPHMFRWVGAKYLPVSGNVLLHFDSHPDLALPKDLHHDHTTDIGTLYDQLSIESWILPAVYLGVISSVVWVCPPWANQFAPGLLHFHVGRNKHSGLIGVTSREAYFLSEGVYMDETELENTRPLTLHVIRTDQPDLASALKSLHSMIQESPNQSYILDIDLDFFSTKNPFLSLYPLANVYARLRDVYTFQPVPAGLSESEQKTLAQRSSEHRRQLLHDLSCITNFLHQGGNLAHYTGPGMEFASAFAQLKQLIQLHYGGDEAIDWQLIHNAGCTWDDSPLPHHVSSKEQICSLVQHTKRFLTQIQCLPSIVTVARSAEDDFCPKDQVDFIQEQVLHTLTSFLGPQLELDLQFGYHHQGH